MRPRCDVLPMLVRDLMSTELVTVERDASLATAVEAMLDARTGSALVIDDRVPVGIVTSSDVLRAVLESGRPVDALDVDGTMSRPLVTIEPTATVTRALELMAEEGVRKLPVVEQLSIQGVVTTTDIARQLPEHVAEVRRLESKGGRWQRRDD